MRRIVAAGCLGLVLAGATGAAVAAPLTMMPVRLLDTSGEGGDHAARQALMGDALAVAWAEAEGGARGPTLTPATVAAECPDAAPACLLALASRSGHGPAAFLVVQKASTLILTLYASIVDPATGRLIAHRELSFRGDNDTAWQKAGTFAGRSLAAAAGAGPSGQSAVPPAPGPASLPVAPAIPPGPQPRH